MALRICGAVDGPDLLVALKQSGSVPNLRLVMKSIDHLHVQGYIWIKSILSEIVNVDGVVDRKLVFRYGHTEKAEDWYRKERE